MLDDLHNWLLCKSLFQSYQSSRGEIFTEDPEAMQRLREELKRTVARLNERGGKESEKLYYLLAFYSLADFTQLIYSDARPKMRLDEPRRQLCKRLLGHKDLIKEKLSVVWAMLLKAKDQGQEHEEIIISC